MSEDKKMFVEMLNSTLIVCGDGRYDYLRVNPLTFVKEGESEYVCQGNDRVCVTADSLPAIMHDIHKGLFE